MNMNMNRRGFLGGCVAAIAAAAAPAFLPGAGRRWKVVNDVAVPNHAILNPEYLTATHEVWFVGTAFPPNIIVPEGTRRELTPVIHKRGTGTPPMLPGYDVLIRQEFPPRFYIGPGGVKKWVDPYKLCET